MRNKMIMLIPVLFLMTLVGCNNIDENENREVSPTFSLPVTFDDGTKGEYLLIGEEGKVGLLVGSGKTGEAVEEKFIANKANKHMWYFWGEKDSISGDFKVLGIDKEGKEHPVLLSGNNKVWQFSDFSNSPNDGADSHIPSNMVFPTSGLWKLEIYFNDKLFGKLVINVEES
ncbi:DUF4871 domain-containing protein [Lysinibacillus xylanilyticus]|uniref:DUF4871 domain-containing protein n=1 Tax=Lysinibacillus xylanilyticus TaxID=582475 RepID=UPI003812AB5E